MLGRQKDTPSPGSGVDVARHDPAALARLGTGVHSTARWTLRLLVIAAGLWVLSRVFGWLWPILLPILLALVITSVLWPPVRWMRRKLPPALAAALGLLGLFGVIAAIVWLIIPVVTAEAQNLADQTSAGLESLQTWLSRPPFNLDDKGLGGLVDQAVGYLQNNAQTVATTAFASLTAIGSAVITLVLALILTFFMLKDGPKFLPWLERWVGVRTGYHADEVAGRVWAALGQYIWSQAAVAAVDGVFIGLGLWLLGVPLALPIGVLTFLGGFIPIVGAFVAGGVAVLVALVTNGVWTAVFALLIVLAVQQIEGNVLQPILVGRTLKLHAAVVIAGVFVGGSLFGIIGAFFAVPIIAATIVVAQYLRSQVTDEAPPPVGTLDPDAAPEGQGALHATPDAAPDATPDAVPDAAVTRGGESG